MYVSPYSGFQPGLSMQAQPPIQVNINSMPQAQPDLATLAAQQQAQMAMLQFQHSQQMAAAAAAAAAVPKLARMELPENDERPAGSYEGSVLDNKPHNEGRITFKANQLGLQEYVGNWINGSMQGKGLLRAVNGVTLEGEFIKGRLTGQGKWSGRGQQGEDIVMIGPFANSLAHGIMKKITTYPGKAPMEITITMSNGQQTDDCCVIL